MKEKFPWLFGSFVGYDKSLREERSSAILSILNTDVEFEDMTFSPELLRNPFRNISVISKLELQMEEFLLEWHEAQQQWEEQKCAQINDLHLAQHGFSLDRVKFLADN